VTCEDYSGGIEIGKVHVFKLKQQLQRAINLGFEKANSIQNF